MLKIWGRLSSINVRKVVLAAQWLRVPFERVDAGHEFGIVGAAEYKTKNPNGLVPMIEDDGLQLWESNVIVRYLCAKHSPGDFYPHDLPKRFDAERWMDWQQTTLNPAGRGAFVQLIRTAEDKRDPNVIASSVAATEALIAILDAHLVRRAFMGGDTFGMADIPIACEVHRWHGLPVPHATLPHVSRWYEGIAANPASRGVLDVALS